MRRLNKKYEAECATKLNMMLNARLKKINIWLDVRLN